MAFVDRPTYSPVYVPAMPSTVLSDDERRLIESLQMRGWDQRQQLELRDLYYRGLQVITNLRIAIPKELEHIRVVVGWPRQGIDPFVERLSAEGFRLPGATDADPDLEAVWSANGLDADQSLVFTDALVMGRAWIAVGSPASAGGSPVMAVESPLNMAVEWDLRAQSPRAALQSYWQDGRRHAALYTPEQTVHIAESDTGVWELVQRDMHGFGLVPLVRVANRARTYDRDGSSEITPELMSIVDAACRTALRMDVAGEFYSVPQKLILGASEKDFQNADGTSRSAWSTYISRVLALERDEQGETPDVKQFQPHDPSVFLKELEFYASQAAGIMAANPQDLGLYTQGNPTSADAMTVVESRRDRRSRFQQRMFQRPLVEAMQLAARFMHGGALPERYAGMSVDWADPQAPNFTAAADAVSKLVGAGVLPAASDVTLKRLGFGPVDRARIEQDRRSEAGEQALAELAAQLGQGDGAPTR